jgi:SAM-dependent methyltransferase
MKRFRRVLFSLPSSRGSSVVMLHVIEHLDDPAGTLEAIARVLRPHGFLAVETPVYNTLMYRLLGRRERSLSCDGHIVFHTGRTLAALLERCGFEIVAQRQQMIERVSAALGLIHRGRLYLNTGDMLRVFARRVASVAETATEMR